jgi:hypothetical protein
MGQNQEQLMQMAKLVIDAGWTDMDPEHLISQEDAQNIILMQLESCGCRLPDVNPNDIYCGNFRGWMSFRKMIPCEDDILKSMPSV